MQRDVDTFVNVVKRREEILYKANLHTYASNIAYVASEALSSLNSITIADRSTSLSGNRIEETEVSILSDVVSINTNTPDFLLTDVFTSDTGSTPIPLFYKHILSTDHVPRAAVDDLTLAADTAILGVEILDTFLQPVEVPALFIDDEEGIIYSNFMSEFNSSTDYALYYVKYTVRTGTGGATEIITYTDLMDQEPVFREAEFDDLTLYFRIKQDGRKVYLIEELTSSYVITLPSLRTVAFKQEAGSKLELIYPVPQGRRDPWHVRVRNGQFNQNVGGSIYRYRIAEFLNQRFNPVATIKYSDEEYAAVVNKSTIKLDFENIQLDPDENFFMNVEVYDREGAGVAAFTTDPSIVGNTANNGKPYRKWDTTDRIGIRSVDRQNGLVDIEGIRLLSSYTIRASYYFDEAFYEFTLVDFNPVSNREILDYKVALFIYPERSGTSRTRTLYYLQIDKTGKVVRSNWEDFDNDNEALDGGDLLYYKDIPAYLTSPPPYQRFIEDYSVEASGLSTGTFLILGDVTVAPPSTVNEITAIDARRRGGGIIDTMYEDALEAQPEARWFWDEGYWDGVPYPGNASYLVEIPVNIMEGAGGEFRADEVTDIINKHTALGVYPAIKAYGIDITLSGIEPAANSITLRWDYIGYPLTPDDPSAE